MVVVLALGKRRQKETSLLPNSQSVLVNQGTPDSWENYVSKKVSRRKESLTRLHMHAHTHMCVNTYDYRHGHEHICPPFTTEGERRRERKSPDKL